MTKSHVLCVLIALTTGCVADPDLASVEQAAICPTRFCNSPEVAHYGLWEANIWGQPNSDGIAIKSFNSSAYMTKNGGKYQLSVTNGRLIGSNKFSSISGQGLVGAKIELMLAGSPYYDITITGVRVTGTAFVAGAPGSVETYTMVWHEPGTSWTTGKGLCNSPLSPTADAKTYELLGMLPQETLLFEGDRYDIEHMTTNVTGDNSWFNFGCAGHTLAKLYLTRNTIKTQPQPDWAQRQATLKMFVADYCGSGESFTLAGEPLVWKGGLQAGYPVANLTTLDARWLENGATCLGDPRIDDSPNPDADIQFPNPVQQIQDACERAGHPLPRCSNLSDIHSFDGARVVSANRVP